MSDQKKNLPALMDIPPGKTFIGKLSLPLLPSLQPSSSPPRSSFLSRSPSPSTVAILPPWYLSFVALAVHLTSDSSFLVSNVLDPFLRLLVSLGPESLKGKGGGEGKECELQRRWEGVDSLLLSHPDLALSFLFSASDRAQRLLRLRNLDRLSLVEHAGSELGSRRV